MKPSCPRLGGQSNRGRWRSTPGGMLVPGRKPCAWRGGGHHKPTARSRDGSPGSVTAASPKGTEHELCSCISRSISRLVSPGGWVVGGHSHVMRPRHDGPTAQLSTRPPSMNDKASPEPRRLRPARGLTRRDVDRLPLVLDPLVRLCQPPVPELHQVANHHGRAPARKRRRRMPPACEFQANRAANEPCMSPKQRPPRPGACGGSCAGPTRAPCMPHACPCLHLDIPVMQYTRTRRLAPLTRSAKQSHGGSGGGGGGGGGGCAIPKREPSSQERRGPCSCAAGCSYCQLHCAGARQRHANPPPRFSKRNPRRAVSHGARPGRAAPRNSKHSSKSGGAIETVW